MNGVATSTSAERPLFDEVVAALQPTLRSVAPFVLARLLLRAGIFEKETLRLAELQAALPTIEAGLAEVLPPNDLAPTMNRVRAVVHG